MRTLMKIALVLLVLVATTSARASDPRCDGIGAHPHDTVIALDESGRFTICRAGEVQDDVVTGRSVWLELQPSHGKSVYEYRIAERDEEPTVSGLMTWHEHAAAVAHALADLAHSAATIYEIPPQMPTDARTRALATARELYLGVATERFHEALHDVAAGAEELPTVAAAVRRWCDHLGAGAELDGEVTAVLQASCAAPALDEARLRPEVDALETAVRDYHAKRSTARDALIVANAVPDDGARQQEAVRALDAARAAALAVIAEGERLRPTAATLARDTNVLRQAIHSGGVLRPGVPVMLARYGRAGTGILRIDVRPRGIIVAGVKEARADTHTLTFRFAIVESHYVDLEAGLGITGGLPLVPSLTTQNGMVMIEGHQVDQFVALALVELEPLRFAWPDKPLAGLLRLPVLAIPLSESPTDHFFVGAGLGWTGVGSLTVGPYLVRETTLRSGYAIGQPLPPGSSFSAITHPELQVGYYISASVDLLGLFHLFVPVRMKSIDATTGKEL